MEEKLPFLMYKGRPLVRSGDVIFYGNLTDRCVVMMQILDKKTENDCEYATKISLELQDNDPEAKPSDRILQKATKNSLAEAIELGTIWLDRADKGI